MDKTKLNEMIRLAEAQRPKAWQACYPRNIVPPSNYINPRYYSVDLWSHTLYWNDPRLVETPHLTESLVVQHLVAEGVPTYFVAHELAVAVNRTRLPEEFTLQDIKWPREALLFVLPDTFIKKAPFKCYTPFIGLARVASGIYPKRRFDFGPQPQRMENTVERLCVHFPLFYDNDLPCDLTLNLPTTRSHKDIVDVPYNNVVPMETALHGVKMDVEPMTMGRSPTEEDEKEHLLAMDLFAIKLLFVLSACPSMVKEQVVERPAKLKNGKVVQRELWKANVIGAEFRMTRENAGGTHASPCTHIRWGHLRKQRHGPGNALTKTIWIAPTLVGKES